MTLDSHHDHTDRQNTWLTGVSILFIDDRDFAHNAE